MKLKPIRQLAGISNSYPYDTKEIEQLSVHCSHQSRQADEVSREVESALKCHYMKPLLDETSWEAFLELRTLVFL